MRSLALVTANIKWFNKQEVIQQENTKHPQGQCSWNRLELQIKLYEMSGSLAGKKCFLELCFCHRAFRKLLVVLLKKPKPCLPLQNAVHEGGSCSGYGRFEDCDSGCRLWQRYLGGLWCPSAYLDLSYFQNSGCKDGVCGSIAPMLHSEGIHSNASASLCGLGVFNSFGTATSTNSNSDKRWV